MSSQDISPKLVYYTDLVVDARTSIHAFWLTYLTQLTHLKRYHQYHRPMTRQKNQSINQESAASTSTSVYPCLFGCWAEAETYHVDQILRLSLFRVPCPLSIYLPIYLSEVCPACSLKSRDMYMYVMYGVETDSTRW